MKQMKRNFLKRLEPDMLFYYEEVLKREHDPEADIAVENIRSTGGYGKKLFYRLMKRGKSL